MVRAPARLALLVLLCALSCTVRCYTDPDESALACGHADFPSHPPPPPSFSPLAVQAERRAGCPRHQVPAGLVDVPRHARPLDVQPVRRQRGRGRLVGRPVRRRRVGTHRLSDIRHDAGGVWRQVRRLLRSLDSRASALLPLTRAPVHSPRRRWVPGQSNGAWDLLWGYKWEPFFGVSTLLITQVQSAAWASSPTCTCALWASKGHSSP